MSHAAPREGMTAGLLAAAVHGFFVLLLVVGVSWQIHDPQPVMADLWRSLPALPEPEPAPPPQIKPEPVPDNKAADIALEKKQREAQEQLKRKQAAEAAEKKRREEARQKELELQREAAEKAKKLAEAKRREESLRQEEEELMRQSIAAESGQIKASAAAARRASEVDKLVARYQDMISAKIRGNTRLPDNLAGNPQVEFKLNVLPTGEVAKITLKKSSGNPAFDQAVQHAIEKSSPLPLPSDRDAAEKFRDLEIKHRARE